MSSLVNMLSSSNNCLSFMLDLYLAPEVHNNEIFDGKVDSYSFGLILYEVCHTVSFHY